MQRRIKYNYWGILLIFLFVDTYAQQDGYRVVWTDLVGCEVKEDTLIKVVNPRSWENSGSTSINKLKKEVNGWVSMVTIEGNTKRMLGLAKPNDIIHYRSIDYAIYLTVKKEVKIYEKGKQMDVSENYTKGDVFKIERKEGQILYIKNEKVFYTSTDFYNGELIVDANIYSYKGTVANVFTSFDVTEKFKKWSNDTLIIEHPKNKALKLCRMYNHRGNLRAEGNYKNGKKEGLWTFFYNNGKIEKLEEYEKGELSGVALSFQESGINESVINFAFANDTIRQKDARNPYLEHLTIYNANGNLKAIGGLLKNEKNGNWKEFNDEGFLERLIQYSQNKREGLFYLLDEHRGIIEEATYKSDRLDGKRVKYKLHGKKGKRSDNREYKPSLVEYYKDGVLNGLFQNYYNNGNIQEESNYLNGIKHGTSIWYYETGELLSEFEYQNGQLLGESKAFHQNGNLKSQSFYKSNKINGIYKSYHENGQIEKEGEYQNGKKEGKWEYYDETGKSSKTEWYDKGELVKSKE